MKKVYLGVLLVSIYYSYRLAQVPKIRKQLLKVLPLLKPNQLLNLLLKILLKVAP